MRERDGRENCKKNRGTLKLVLEKEEHITRQVDNIVLTETEKPMVLHKEVDYSLEDHLPEGTSHENTA